MHAADEGFDPADLFPEASLNRTVIPDAAPFPPELRGARGFDLLGAGALSAIPATPTGVPEVGRRLAALIAALVARDGPRDGRGLEPTRWRLAYLSHWSRVEEVWLGGGTAARFGPDIARAATRFLADYDARTVIRSHGYPGWLPLIGAARTMPDEHRDIIVLDLGHSWVKRGVAHFDADRGLCSLDVLRPVPVDVNRTARREVINFFDAVIDMSCSEYPAAAGVRAAVAAYVTPHGVLEDPRSYYAALGTLPQHSGRASLVHDGTAAAAAIESSVRAAVVTLGTAIGVGFATERWRRRIAGGFVVRP